MILMYHNIKDKSGFNTVSTNFFYQQMEYISSRGKYSLLSMDEYINNLQNQSIPNPLTVTLDDGYRSLLDKVLPVIKELEIPISIFLSTDFIGSHNVWDVQNGHMQIEISTWDELESLSKEELVTIGSHGVSHLSHGKLNANDEKSEMLKSKEDLETRLKIPVEYYSFPYGQLRDIGKMSKEHLQSAGYKAALSTIWSRSNTLSDLYCLHRLEISENDDMNSFIRKLESAFDMNWCRQQLKNIYYYIKI